MRSLQTFQPAAAPKPAPAPVRKMVFRELSAVVLTQVVLYRTLGGKDKLIRPGHKMLPRGAIGIVKSVIDEGKSYQIELRTPIVGMLDVAAQEIKALD